MGKHRTCVVAPINSGGSSSWSWRSLSPPLSCGRGTGRASGARSRPRRRRRSRASPPRRAPRAPRLCHAGRSALPSPTGSPAGAGDGSGGDGHGGAGHRARLRALRPDAGRRWPPSASATTGRTPGSCILRSSCSTTRRPRPTPRRTHLRLERPRPGRAARRRAHFVIDEDGTIYQQVPLDVRCRHAVGLDWCAVGIEFVQPASSGPRPPSPRSSPASGSSPPACASSPGCRRATTSRPTT